MARTRLLSLVRSLPSPLSVSAVYAREWLTPLRLADSDELYMSGAKKLYSFCVGRSEVDPNQEMEVFNLIDPGSSFVLVASSQFHTIAATCTAFEIDTLTFVK